MQQKVCIFQLGCFLLQEHEEVTDNGKSRTWFQLDKPAHIPRKYLQFYGSQTGKKLLKDVRKLTVN